MEATNDASIGEMSVYELTRQTHALQRALQQAIQRIDLLEMNDRLHVDKITRHDNRLAGHQNTLAELYADVEDLKGYPKALAQLRADAANAVAILERKGTEHEQRLEELELIGPSLRLHIKVIEDAVISQDRLLATLHETVETIDRTLPGELGQIRECLSNQRKTIEDMDGGLMRARAAIDVLNHVAQRHNEIDRMLVDRVDALEQAQTAIEGSVADLEEAVFEQDEEDAERAEAAARPAPISGRDGIVCINGEKFYAGAWGWHTDDPAASRVKSYSFAPTPTAAPPRCAGGCCMVCLAELQQPCHRCGHGPAKD